MKRQDGFLITRIKQVGGRIFERILAQENIYAFNGSQMRILYVLWQKDDFGCRKTCLIPTIESDRSFELRILKV